MQVNGIEYLARKYTNIFVKAMDFTFEEKALLKKEIYDIRIISFTSDW